MLSDRDLPGVWVDADAKSNASQRQASRTIIARMVGALIAAGGGALGWRNEAVDVGGYLIVLGFAVALIAEVVGWQLKSAPAWHKSRAVAESEKTLSWRFAVAAAPFPPTLSTDEALALLRTRTHRLLVDSDLVLSSPHAVVSQPMLALRASGFEERRHAYLTERLTSQQQWYARKAQLNASRARMWRIGLILIEVTAIGCGAVRIMGAWSVDVAGFLAAFLGAGTTWLGFRQHDQLAAAYRIAANELALARQSIASATEVEWPAVVADAEDAISREHTMWSASRTASHG